MDEQSNVICVVWPGNPAGPIRVPCLLQYELKSPREVAGNYGHGAKRSWGVGAGARGMSSNYVGGKPE